MQLTFNSLPELEDMIIALGYVKQGVGQQSPAPTATKKPAPKKPAPKKTETKTKETETEGTEVTHEELLAYIQANCADNIQAVKDVLAKVGAAKVSDIAPEKRAEALAILKGE